MTQEEFIRRCYEKYGNDFDYSLVNYENPKSRIKIKCNTCGQVFEVRADHFLYDKRKGCCPLCKYEFLRKNFSFTKEQFVDKAKKLYGDVYDYSSVNYVNMHTPVIIIDRDGNSYSIVPMIFLNGTFRRKKRIKDTKTERGILFIEKSKKIHGNKYDYSKVSYINARTRVKIVCPIHGDFEQKPYHHVSGVGCPYCNRSLGEEKVEKVLKDYNIKFLKQHKLKNENIFCVNNYFYVDFFIPTQNIVIEYNGQQHYQATGYFGGEKKLQYTKERDMALRQYCKEHGIKLIEIPYWDYDNIETILKKELKIK